MELHPTKKVKQYHLRSMKYWLTLRLQTRFIDICRIVQINVRKRRRAIKNGQARNTGNIEQKHRTHKTKRLSNFFYAFMIKFSKCIRLFCLFAHESTIREYSINKYDKITKLQKLIATIYSTQVSASSRICNKSLKIPVV